MPRTPTQTPRSLRTRHRRAASHQRPCQRSVLPSEKDAPEQPAEAGDGIDALGDPYFSPVVPNDLTEARVPVVHPVPGPEPARAQAPSAGAGRWPSSSWPFSPARAVLRYSPTTKSYGGKTIPRVVGLTQEEATRALESLGFVVSVEPVAADDGFGVVLGVQSVGGPARRPRRWRHLSWQASAPYPRSWEWTSSPPIRLFWTRARRTSRLVPELRPARRDGSGREPRGGSAFVSSDPITVTVARAFTVPASRGCPLSDAQAQLEAGGLTSSVIYVESDAEKSTVVSLDPPAGTEVAEGATITLGGGDAHARRAL